MLGVSIEITYKRLSIEAEFDIQQDEIVGLYGPSGSGKTSVLMFLSGLVSVGKGNITLNQVPWTFQGVSLLKPQKRQIGLMLQNSVLFPNLSVEENIKFNLGEEAFEFDFLIENLGLRDVLGAKPTELSGGQIQRVALARVLHRKNELLLLDEPVSALDEENTAIVSELLKEYVHKFRVPTLLVSHNKSFLLSCSDRLLRLILDEKNKKTIITT